MSLPPDVPPEVVGFLQEMGYLEPDCLQVGDTAPMLTLARLHTDLHKDFQPVETVTLGAPDAVRPTVLIFGSYT